MTGSALTLDIRYPPVALREYFPDPLRNPFGTR